MKEANYLVLGLPPSLKRFPLIFLNVKKSDQPHRLPELYSSRRQASFCN